MSEQTVYVVERGDYDTNHVAAVFTDRAAAEHYCRVRDPNWRPIGNGQCGVVECRLNPVDAGPWWYQVDFMRGEEPGLAQFIDDADQMPDRRTITEVRPKFIPCWWYLRVWVEARDPEHAVTIASEQRAAWLAEQAGIG